MIARLFPGGDYFGVRIDGSGAPGHRRVRVHARARLESVSLIDEWKYASRGRGRGHVNEIVANNLTEKL